MEKNFKAVYGIAVQKSNCSAYVLEQKIIKKIKEQSDILKITYQNRWKDKYAILEDRVLAMEKPELEMAWEILQEKNVLEFNKELSKIKNRNR
jgi:hypothetical protein